MARFVQTLNYDMYWHFSRLYYPDNFYSNPQNDYGEDTILHILGENSQKSAFFEMCYVS